MVVELNSDLLYLMVLFLCRMETTLKNQEMELIRNKERLQFFKVLQT